MGVDQVVSLGRTMLLEVIILASPLLGVVLVISFVMSILQVLTSLQDQTLAAVPRLLAAGVALFVLMPWMWRHLALYTVHLLGNFQAVLR